MKRLSVILLLLFAACRNDKPVWLLPLESRSYAKPIIEGDSVYIISEAGEVIACDYRTGTRHWRQKLNAPIFGDPTVSGQLLFVGTEKGAVVAFDQKSGAQRWRKEFLNETFVSPLTVYQDTLFAPSRTGILYALQKETGDTRWMFPDAKVLMAGVAIRDPYVLIGGWDRSMDCLDLKTGVVKWRFQIDEPIVGTGLVIANQVIFGGHEHSFWALDIPTGKLVWKREAYLHSNGVLLNNRFIYGIRDVLCVVDARNGAVLRQMQTKGHIDSVYNWDGRLVVLSKNRMYRIDVDTNQSTLLLSAEQPLYRAAFPPGMFIVTDQFYTVFGFRQQ